MSRATIFSIGISLIALYGGGILPVHAQPRDIRAVGVQGNPTVLLKGPVHEAFAQPFSLQARPTPAIEQRPPALVKEVPPKFKPKGSSVWVPGYWEWDDPLNRFVWVSGVWRVPPAGRRWVPGYWAETDAGYRRVSGTWLPDTQQQVSYLPAPPRLPELGPNRPAPSGDYFWVPGHWEFGRDGYEWEPGFWSRFNENMMWIPAHYSWTPGGHVFVSGYWDYPLTRRGWLFAPVYFTEVEPGESYVPSIVVNTAELLTELFARPRWNHYYFGDYYDFSYARTGTYPWFSFARAEYDPLFIYNRWYLGAGNPDWLEQLRETFVIRRDNPSLRPPETFAEAQEDEDRPYAFPLREFVAQKDFIRTVMLLTDAERQEVFNRAMQLRRLQARRGRLENDPATLVGAEGREIAGTARRYTALRLSPQDYGPLGDVPRIGRPATVAAPGPRTTIDPGLGRAIAEVDEKVMIGEIPELDRTQRPQDPALEYAIERGPISHDRRQAVANDQFHTRRAGSFSAGDPATRIRDRFGARNRETVGWAERMRTITRQRE